MKKFLLNLLLKLPRWILRLEIEKLQADKAEAEKALHRVIDASRKAIEAADKQVSAREAQIIEYQDKMQKVFYDEEQTQLKLLEAHVIDPKEYHYSVELIKKIEKKLS